jgi:hypothetical protein
MIYVFLVCSTILINRRAGQFGHSRQGGLRRVEPLKRRFITFQSPATHKVPDWVIIRFLCRAVLPVANAIDKAQKAAAFRELEDILTPIED